MAFIREVTNYLHERHTDNLKNCCIVFPNRRAGLFFGKYLAELAGKPVWSPHIKSISDFMQSMSELLLADSLTLLFELYNVYIKERNIKESFDDFYFWGDMLLNDFDDIDKYLVDAKSLFQYIESLKEIDSRYNYLTKEQIEAIKQFWSSFTPEKYSGGQKDFLQIWKTLYNIYLTFRENLRKQGIAYEGMIFRDVAENINIISEIKPEFPKIIFIGFNALSKAEEKLFDFLYKSRKGEFYWDYDKYYIGNELEEAGYFLRKNLKRYPSPENFQSKHELMLSGNKNIEVIAVPSNTGQAKLLPGILKEIKIGDEIEPDNTAIILPDERLLIPVLYSLPENINDVNITMGYPVSETPAYSLISHIIKIKKNSKISTDGNIIFYYQDVLSILKHPYIKNNNSSEIENLIQDIHNKNRIYISTDFFNNIPLLKEIFIRFEKVEQTGEYLINILYKTFCLLQIEREKSHNLWNMQNREYIYHLYITLNRLNGIVKQRNMQISHRTYLTLLNNIIKKLNIPFTGEPLAGLQVMGMLETRVLDFENIIILSMNEGIMPKAGFSSSFIPYNLRLGYGLPTIENQDAIYSYYFYRLLQHANNIFLVYNTCSADISASEMSRFIFQLKYGGNFNIKEKTAVYDLNIKSRQKIIIKKTPDIIEKLNKYIAENNEQKSFSPSAINTYLDCGLKFYFRYIAGIEEPVLIAEEVDAGIFGSLLHYAMNFLYSSYKGKTINTENLESIRKKEENIERAILSAFESEYLHCKTKDKQSLAGKNILIFEVLKKYIYQLLEIDKKYAPFQIIGLEKNYSANIQATIEERKQPVSLKGKIDRLDKVGDVIRIIDYKTGEVSNKFSDIPSLFAPNDKDRNSAVFQLFYYCLLYEMQANTPLKIYPGIYWLKALFDDSFDFRIRQAADKNKYIFVNNAKEYLNEFYKSLSNVLTEIFNKDLSFYQAEELAICKYCPYLTICNK
ncbi:MAG: PD-(D/E)XK nuclease family protein [Bacteroidia bacterium]|nr:PD-(D/E)XK nuclease family protein [Bacteroidia bacterium]